MRTRVGVVVLGVAGMFAGCEEGGASAGGSLEDVAGDWRAADPLADDRPDTMQVEADGTGIAILVWAMQGSLWEVRLEVEFAVGDGDFEAAFTCPMDCSEWDFEARCVLVDDELRCHAPDWYWTDRIVFVPSE